MALPSARLCPTSGGYTRKGEFCSFRQGSLIIYGRDQKQVVKYLALAVALECKERAAGQKVLLVSEDLGGAGSPGGYCSEARLP